MITCRVLHEMRLIFTKMKKNPLKWGTKELSGKICSKIIKERELEGTFEALINEEPNRMNENDPPFFFHWNIFKMACPAPSKITWWWPIFRKIPICTFSKEFQKNPPLIGRWTVEPIALAEYINCNAKIARWPFLQDVECLHICKFQVEWRPCTSDGPIL